MDLRSAADAPVAGAGPDPDPDLSDADADAASAPGRRAQSCQEASLRVEVRTGSDSDGVSWTLTPSCGGADMTARYTAASAQYDDTYCVSHGSYDLALAETAAGGLGSYTVSFNGEGVGSGAGDPSVVDSFAHSFGDATCSPTAGPTPGPSAGPSSGPSPEPSGGPSAPPSPGPSPSPSLSRSPSSEASAPPTLSAAPSPDPSPGPSPGPTSEGSAPPSASPAPSSPPSPGPSSVSSPSPSSSPSDLHSAPPSVSRPPSVSPLPTQLHSWGVSVKDGSLAVDSTADDPGRGIVITMTFLAGLSADRETLGVYAQDCSTPPGDALVSSGFDSVRDAGDGRHSELDVRIELESSKLRDSPLWTADGVSESAGSAALCVLVELWKDEGGPPSPLVPPAPMSYRSARVVLMADLGDNAYSVTPDLFSGGVVHAGVARLENFRVAACFCSGGVDAFDCDGEDDPPVMVQNAEVEVCIWPTSPSVVIRNFDMFFRQDGNEPLMVVDGLKPGVLTAVTPYGGGSYKVSARALGMFFVDPRPVNVTGTTILAFPSPEGGRRDLIETNVFLHDVSPHHYAGGADGDGGGDGRDPAPPGKDTGYGSIHTSTPHRAPVRPVVGANYRLSLRVVSAGGEGVPTPGNVAGADSAPPDPARDDGGGGGSPMGWVLLIGVSGAVLIMVFSLLVGSGFLAWTWYVYRRAKLDASAGSESACPPPRRCALDRTDHTSSESDTFLTGKASSSSGGRSRASASRSARAPSEIYVEERDIRPPPPSSSAGSLGPARSAVVPSEEEEEEEEGGGGYDYGECDSVGGIVKGAVAETLHDQE